MSPPVGGVGASDLLRRSLYLPLGVLGVYTAFFLALLTPVLQRHFIFLHAIQFPFRPSFDQPDKYGLAPAKTRALTITTADGERIGAWHVLPELAYHAAIAHGQPVERARFDETVYDEAMREWPTVLYLHGNAMHRAAPWRIAAYSALTSRMDVNVVAIDYRGFGDSTGTPSEDGVVNDARAAYDWIRQHQAGSEQSVTLFGQSLGTGIAAILATQLQAQGDPVHLVLMAPYANLRSLVSDFRLGGFLPLLAPIKALPFHDWLLERCMQTRLDTLATLPTLMQTARGNVVLLHARDDPVIPAAHSHHLFTALRSRAHKPPLHHRTLDNFAHIHRFHPTHASTVSLIETLHGGHNQLTEGALDLVRTALNLPSHLSPPRSTRGPT